MNNYEAIKGMSIEEMAAVFFMFLKPLYDSFGISEDQKKEIRRSIKAFLETEVKHENRRSQT